MNPRSLFCGFGLFRFGSGGQRVFVFALVDRIFFVQSFEQNRGDVEFGIGIVDRAAGRCAEDNAVTVVLVELLEVLGDAEVNLVEQYLLLFGHLAHYLVAVLYESLLLAVQVLFDTLCLRTGYQSVLHLLLVVADPAFEGTSFRS